MKCKNCIFCTWACPGWMCMNEKHPNFKIGDDYPIFVKLEDNSCPLFCLGDNDYQKFKRRISCKVQYKKRGKRMAMIDEIKKEIFCSMKFSDTTIAGIKETEEYKIKQAYNKGLRDALNIFNKHIASEKYEEATK